MRRFVHAAVAAMAVGVFGVAMSAYAQRGHPPVHPAVHPHHVIFVGGYFYDPFFGPAPWWGPVAYPYPYYPAFDARAVVRVIATPKDAGVYVDGFYAGVVDDFDGFFQGLPLTPGGHTIVLYLPGYRSYRQQVYLGPGSTFKLQTTLVPIAAGETSEPPTIAPAIPMPPTGTFMPPHTPAPTTPNAPARAADAALPTVGTLELQVQPPDAVVRIDGEPWVTSDHGRFAVQLAAGAHRLDVSAAGYRAYETDLTIPENGSVQLVVTLTRGITP